MSGLDSMQQWTHDHIVRCPTCGSWEVVMHLELLLRAADKAGPKAMCAHIGKAFAIAEERSIA